MIGEAEVFFVKVTRVRKVRMRVVRTRAGMLQMRARDCTMKGRSWSLMIGFLILDFRGPLFILFVYESIEPVICGLKADLLLYLMSLPGSHLAGAVTFIWDLGPF